MPFTIGETVGPYNIVQQLGQGGMATVYRAYHANLDRYVAIKVLHAALQSDPNFSVRFQREAQIIAKLEHPYIVPVYDYNQANNEPYLVMKFIEGETLRSRMSRQALTVGETAKLIAAIGSALTYAHERDVLHRDIKPSNILLDTQGVPYLADFGLARIASAGESTLSRDMMLGTPQYISPEQAQGNVPLTGATDIYSLGVVLYELVTGDVPFNSATPYAIIHDQIYKPLPLPSSVNKNVPMSVEQVLLKALAKNPAERYATANQLAEAFQQAVGEAKLTESKVVATPPRADTVHLAQKATSAALKTPFPLPTSVVANTAPAPTQIARRRGPALILAAGIIALAFLAGVLLTQNNRSGGTPVAAQATETATEKTPKAKQTKLAATLTVAPTLTSTPDESATESEGDATPTPNRTPFPTANALATIDPATYDLSMLDAQNIRRINQVEAQRFVDENPTNPVGYFRLAYLLASNTRPLDIVQRMEQAQEAFLAGLNRCSSDPQLMLKIAHKYEALPGSDTSVMLQSSITTLEIYAYVVGWKYSPDLRAETGKDIYQFAADAHNQGLNRTGTTRRNLLQRAATASNNSFIYAAFALAAQNTDSLREVQPALLTALELDSNLPESKLIMGIILKLQNKSSDARKTLGDVQKEDDAPSWVRDEARKQLEGL